MYRLCESYLSGALDPLAFQTQQQRLHSSMVAILAIEQLTGTVRTPTVLLEGNTVGAANDISKLTKDVLKGRQALDIANSALSQATINEKAASISAENAKNEEQQKKDKNPKNTTDLTAAALQREAAENTLKDVKNKLDAAQKNQKDATAQVALLEKSMTTAQQSGNTSTATKGSIQNVNSAQPASDAAVEVVTKSVSTIVTSVCWQCLLAMSFAYPSWLPEHKRAHQSISTATFS